LQVPEQEQQGATQGKEEINDNKTNTAKLHRKPSTAFINKVLRHPFLAS
jgi:hypothetical protein